MQHATHHTRLRRPTIWTHFWHSISQIFSLFGKTIGGVVIGIIALGILALLGIAIGITVFITNNESYTIYDLALMQPSKLYDRHGELLYTFLKEKRTPVSYDAISPIMVNAIISTEDQDFRTNDGFNLLAIVRSTRQLLINMIQEKEEIYWPGWSTLTQQIVKNTIVGKEKSLERKSKEILYARLLTYNTLHQQKEFTPYISSDELRWKTKQSLVSYYLNSTFFGNNAYGIYEAAERYFWVLPKDLSLAQSAILASIPRSPYRFDLYKDPHYLLGYRSLTLNGREIPITQDSPYYTKLSNTVLSGSHSVTDYIPSDHTSWNHQIAHFLSQFPQHYQTIDDLFPQRSGQSIHGYRTLRYVPWRKDYVINRLYEDHKIVIGEAVWAMLTAVPFQPKTTSLTVFEVPHFVEYIKDTIISNQSLDITEQQLYEGWYRITSTLDLQLTTQLEQLNNIYSWQAKTFWANNRSILIADHHNGEIISYIGSRDHHDTSIQWQVDMIRAPRQIGSTMKPFLYAYALSHYPIGIETIIRDSKKDFWGRFSPSNADGVTRWPIRLRNALVGSRNIPAVKIADFAWGIATMKPYLVDIGMKSLLKKDDLWLAFALGVGEIPMLELAQSYMEFSDSENVGIVHGIAKIENHVWQIIFDHNDYSYKRTIPLGVSKLITHMLSTAAYANSAFQKVINVPHCPNCASKTGTTNMKSKGKNVARDAWIVTYSPEILLTMRAGNADASALGANAYGMTINTDLRNEIIKVLIDTSYMSQTSSRDFPDNETVYYPRQGEWYRNPTHDSFQERSWKLR